MKTLKLVLVRHGQTQHNVDGRLTGWGDPELDETGKAQAEALRDVLLENFPDTTAIYSSPLTRTRQTATPFAQAMKLEIKTHDDLKEYYFGEVEGMTIAEVREKYADTLKGWHSFDEPEFAWPGGETRMVFHTRVDRALWDIIVAEADRNETVAVFGHGAALAGFMAELQTGIPYHWREYLLQNCQFYVVEVHYTTVPVTKETCTLKVVRIGETVPVIDRKP
jgi:broad specificity phosphatase PhoE